jgi:flagellar biosynthesis/type III secretory pathway protein FliH
MGLIKAANNPAKAAVPFSMRDVEEVARGILQRAQRQAEQLIVEAQGEAEALKKSMQAEGFLAGRQEGTATGMEEGRKAGHQAALTEHKAQLAQAINALAAALKQVEGSRKQLEAEALSEVVQLAVAVARKVTKRQGELDEQVVVANLREAMKLVVHAADLRVAVHPAQVKVLAEAMPKLQLEWPALEHAELIEDATLAAGGCRVFTLHGRVDADLDGQLNRVVADLLPPSQWENKGAA